MKQRYFWFCLVALTLGGVAFLPYLAGRSERTKTTQTKLYMAEILADIDLLDQNNAGQLFNVAAEGTDSTVINRKLGALFKASGDKDITAHRLLSRDGLFYDAWGTAFLFLPTNSTPYQLLNPKLKGRSRTFIIWSAGPNRTNEFGNGDDVVSYR